MEVSRLLGGSVLSKYGKNLSVKVKNPDHTVYVDIREDGKTLIYTDLVYCMSGMPVGSAGKGLLLISGGIDSPVAGYMMAKRGMKINCLHFHSFPYTGEAAKNKVEQLTSLLSEYNGGDIRLNVVSFTKIQEEIHKKCPPEFMITMMRRFMMRIAEKFAIKNGLQAIITGESLGQVASQTIESITSSNSVVSMPVLRPLIALDKLEIIDISTKIGTYETSILPYEDCCTVFLPKYPAIRPDLNKVIASEQKLDVESLIEEALNNIEVIDL
jgi:thiamine biosynthesis protein ThiI